MSLIKVLENIQEQIANKELQNNNETDLTQDIWDILNELKWPSKTVKNEYTLSTGGRVDFALIHPDNKEPQVLIELKTVGLTKLKKSKEQVKGYASNSAVPLIVLTDVETWLFYYKGKLAFETGFSLESSTRKLSGKLKEFLEPDRVYRGDVYRSAEGALEKKNNLAKARKRIPAAWRQFLKEERNSSRKNLVNELRKKAGAGLGVQLADDDVVAFLRSLKGPVSKSEGQTSSTPTQETMATKDAKSDTSNTATTPPKPRDTMLVKYPGILVRGNKKPRPKSFPHELLQAFFTGKNAGRKLTYDDALRIGIEGGHVAYRVKWQLDHNLLKRDYIRFDEQAQRNGREEEIEESRHPRAGEVVIFEEKFPFEYKSGVGAMVIVLQELQKQTHNSDLYERIYESDWNFGKTGTRRRIAPSPEELYPVHPHLRKKFKEINNNWVVSTNHARSTIVKIIKHVTEVAGLEFGKDIIVNFDD